MRLAVPAIVAIAVGVAADVAASPLVPPWTAPGVDGVAPWVKSVHVLEPDEPIVSAPDATSPRRGSAAREARLPLYAVASGPGCRKRWLEVGAGAWICEDRTELSGEAPIDARARAFRPTEDGLPFRYYFVGPDGSLGYKRIDAADLGEPDFELQPGFAVAIVEERALDGARYGLTHNGLWVPMRDLGPVHPFAFRGREIAEAKLDFAWVVADKGNVLARPESGAAATSSKVRFEVVPFLDELAQKKLARVGETEWMAVTALRHPTVAAPPPEVDLASDERWIDVELATQTLVAYEGTRPVFATLVSSGKGKPGTANATPPGTYRLWVKVLTSNMDNLEDENAARYYRMEDVPWVQYFSKGVGLHGAFWHHGFGRARSHGCVNLSPLDAERLFAWTSPHLPAGWTAALPSDREKGTVVRVR